MSFVRDVSRLAWPKAEIKNSAARNVTKSRVQVLEPELGSPEGIYGVIHRPATICSAFPEERPE